MVLFVQESRNSTYLPPISYWQHLKSRLRQHYIQFVYSAFWLVKLQQSLLQQTGRIVLPLVVLVASIRDTHKNLQNALGAIFYSDKKQSHISLCGHCNKNDSYRFIYVSTVVPMGGIFEKDWEVWHWMCALRFQTTQAIPSFSFYLLLEDRG